MNYKHIEYINHMKQAEKELLAKLELTTLEKNAYIAGFREAERTSVSLLRLHAGFKFSLL